MAILNIALCEWGQSFSAVGVTTQEARPAKKSEPGSVFIGLQCDVTLQGAALANEIHTSTHGRLLCNVNVVFLLFTLRWLQQNKLIAAVITFQSCYELLLSDCVLQTHLILQLH